MKYLLHMAQTMAKLSFGPIFAIAATFSHGYFASKIPKSEKIQWLVRKKDKRKKRKTYYLWPKQ